ncbi:hypothetical protein LUZ60_008050 [Juncus effusus]|nr:hypothetical protein LUZ60_008050 [Juncus effusus]
MSFFTSISTLLLFISLTLVTLGYMFYPNNFQIHFNSLFTTSFCDPTTASESTHVSNNSGLSLFVGILSRPHLHERRQLLRSVYSLQKRNLRTADVDVRFVFCHSMSEETKMFIALEIMQYNDIIVLNCTENLNEGKTYTYFSTLPTILEGRYDYVVKADDDAYLRLDNLAVSLIDKPRIDLYYGMEIECSAAGDVCGQFKTFMAGFTYVLSWDLVEWISESDIARNEQTGLEDVMLAKWLNTADKGKNRYNGVPAFYDYKEETVDGYTWLELKPDTVALHGLKLNSKWVRTLKYFNVTNWLNVP